MLFADTQPSKRFNFDDTAKWSHFYTRQPAERRTLAAYHPPIVEADASCANCLTSAIENYVADARIPTGLVPWMCINGCEMVLPMATEEPSVIAACSNAAKTVFLHGGGFLVDDAAIVADYRTHSAVQLYVDCSRDTLPCAVAAAIDAEKAQLMSVGNAACAAMVQRGGGVVDVFCRNVPSLEAVIVHVIVDVCDAMGANCVNSVGEAVAAHMNNSTLAAFAAAHVKFVIVTNKNEERFVTARFSLPIAALAHGTRTGQAIAASIVQLNAWAAADAHRAATHIKGLMNGVQALALATGQDTRAIDVCLYAHAFSHTPPNPLTQYVLEAKGDKGSEGTLHASIRLPLLVGTCGSSIAAAAHAAFNLRYMRVKSSRELAAVMACVALAQNFAALRAIATDGGIQRGHMPLQLQNTLRNMRHVPASLHAAIKAEVQRTNDFSRANIDAICSRLEASK